MLLRHLLAIFLVIGPAACWLRTICRDLVLAELKENSSLADDPQIFARNKEGKILSSEPTIALTIPACERMCGTRWEAYPDAAPRLLTWLVPVVVLAANLQYAAIGKQRFLALLHLLGDPIDSTLSAISKVDRWRQIQEGRSKYEAMIVAGVEELVETFDQQFNDAHVRDVLRDMLVRPKAQPAQFALLTLNTASELAECRVNQTIRTWAAIALYLVQVSAAFVPSLGQASSPSGGRIGTAMILSWLLPVVLLSNALGDFSSRRMFLRIMLSFMEQIERQSTQLLSKSSKDLMRAIRQVDERYFQSLARSGAIYTYRPGKFSLQIASKGLGAPLFALISAIPVITGFTTAFLVLYTKPTYFNCRHFLILAVLVAWLLSPLLTWMMGTYLSRKRQWRFVLLKDAVFAFPIMALIVGSSCGLFNSCWCWSGIYTLGIRDAAVFLNNLPQFKRYGQVYYPAVVGTCLALQLLFFLLVRCTCWRGGFNLLNWSERQKETAFLEKGSQSMIDMRTSKNAQSFDGTYFDWDSSYA